MKTTFKFITSLLLILNVVTVYAQNNIEQLDVYQIEKDLDSLFLKYKDEPGVSIGIIINDSLAIQKQYGLANLEFGIPINSETAFHVASVSKQFTAFAILLLESEGKLSLDDDIKKYIPEILVEDNRITIKNLMTHSSGLKDQWNLLRLAGWKLDDIITNEQVLDLIYNQKSLNFQPNKAFLYSNSGYTLLAEIVSRVSNMSFADFTKRRIFNPLAMQNTSFIDQKGIVVANKATSYYKTDNTYKRDIWNNYSIGATNLSTTVEDLSKWMINFKKATIGSVNIFKKMMEPLRLSNGEKINYGLGLFVDNYKGIPRVSHSGVDASYQSYVGAFPQQNISLIITSNNSSINGGGMVRALTEICLKEFIKENPIPKTNTSLTSKRKKPITLNTKILEKFEGYYWNKEDRYSRQISILNDTLFYIRDTGNKTALIPVGNLEFEMASKDYPSVLFRDNKMSVKFKDGYTIEFSEYKPSNYDAKSLSKFTGTFYSEELNSYYTLSVSSGQLVAFHHRIGEFKLEPIMKNYFLGPGSFREIQFKEHDYNQIIGLEVSSSRTKNVLFKKIK
jgi:CubicO group peptidase (beta-lactamase class C family)